MPPKILLYTHPDCAYSGALKEELDGKGTVYEEVDLALNPEAWAEVEHHSGGDRITPVLVENGKATVGYYGVG
ncbi:MAG: UXX-star (seleno)protein family 2 [Chloroflexi bacterium]|nr:UXX-star (seleno)protein family 2 [Chloroflexota bacterium]